MGNVEWLGSQVRFTDLPVPSFWEETGPILGGSWEGLIKMAVPLLCLKEGVSHFWNHAKSFFLRLLVSKCS